MHGRIAKQLSHLLEAIDIAEHNFNAGDIPQAIQLWKQVALERASIGLSETGIDLIKRCIEHNTDPHLDEDLKLTFIIQSGALKKSDTYIEELEKLALSKDPHNCCSSPYCEDMPPHYLLPRQNRKFNENQRTRIWQKVNQSSSDQINDY